MDRLSKYWRDPATLRQTYIPTGKRLALFLLALALVIALCLWRAGAL